MKERNSLEWFLLCSLSSYERKYGPFLNDWVIYGDPLSIATFLSMSHNSLSAYGTSGLEVLGAIVGIPYTASANSSMNRLKNWYRAGGQF